MIIRHGRREQTLFLTGFLCLGLANLVPQVILDSLGKLLPAFFQDILPWLNVIAIVPFVWGIVLVWKKAIPRTVDVAGTVKPSAIKGPFAFGEMDGEIFAKLGREADLARILGWVLDSQICFTALKGESGAGKTSLLRAGLVYGLKRAHEKYGVIPVYWEATPENPREELLRAIHLACPEEKEALPTLDDVLADTAGKKKVLIIDQAEQLSPEKHAAMFDFYRKIITRKPPYHTTWIIAFREEYASAWFDFEATIADFHPPKHSLTIFSEQQARENMTVLARESGLSPDNAVLDEMTAVMAENGRVSPVEIGIGMMVLSELYRGPGSEISLEKFHDAGGVTGLLRTYIQGKLEEGMPAHEHSPMQNVLLNLIDPDTPHQRLAAGRSTVALAKTTHLPLNRVLANLDFLASQTVRILEPLPETPAAPTARYRLAHERLIPALESLAGEMLAAAEEAQRLLNERYRTWAKAKRGKFLLSGKELRDVLKYRGHFKETMTTEIAAYVRSSKRRRVQKTAAVVFFLLALVLWQPINRRVVEPWQRFQRLQTYQKQFVKVAGGRFEMGGSSDLPRANASPVHTVELGDFHISPYETTNQQYCDFLNDDDSAGVYSSEWLDFSNSYCFIRQVDGQFIVLDETKYDHPIVAISWYGAAAFANYLNRREGYPQFYNMKQKTWDVGAKGYHLPTEAEWEYAARGGPQSKGYSYSGSDNVDTVAWYYGNSDSQLYAVGKKMPNELGVYDMSGNIWEWCTDWFDPYYYKDCLAVGIVNNPPGPENGSLRVIRGGSWFNISRYSRSVTRSFNNPGYSNNHLGFRLVFVP